MMCGRISLYTEPERLARRFEAELSPDVADAGEPRWNVPPTQEVLAVIHPSKERLERAGDKLKVSKQGRLLESMRWGLVPFWAKDLSIGNRMFNARAETLESKAAFKSALETHRCLVLADGFYEWKRNDTGGRRRRIPFYFTRADGAPLAFAGLWASWRDPLLPKDQAPWIHSCTIVTTDSGPDVASVHDRMPVVVETEDLQEWIDPHPLDDEALASILRPSAAGTLVDRQVSTEVNNVDNEGPELIEAVTRDSAGAAEEPTLF
jgi:putative SOS response-associated peptidase YedK